MAPVPWQDACVAGAPPHESLEAGPPADVFTAGDAGVCVVVPAFFHASSIGSAVPRVCFGRRVPAVGGAWEQRTTTGIVLRHRARFFSCCAFSP